METLTISQIAGVSGGRAALPGACSPGTLFGGMAAGAFVGAVTGGFAAGPFGILGGAILGGGGGAFGAAVSCAIDEWSGWGAGAGGGDLNAGVGDNGVQCVKEQ